jgi:2',3'-cyclic-nucleotide 2'-phosphodiesterase (5'-nucleotidase family)
MALATNALHLIRGAPNPNGARDAELFLFVGDATSPIDEIIFDAELPTRRTDTREFHLRIFHVNDLHGRLARVTACDHAPIFSRIVARVRAARRDDDPNSATLFLSAGDDLVGTVFEELLCNEALPQRFNPAYRLLAFAGLDAATLGNHEFDAGTRLLADSIRADAHFAILCANLTHCARLDRVIFPAAILVVQGVRVGIVGLTTSAEVIHRDDPNFSIAHPIPVAQNLIAALRPLCDVVIALTHLGHSLSATTAIMRDAGDVELARNLPAGACDLIIGGHTHVALNACGLDAGNVVNDIVLAQAGARGEWLGEIDLVLNPRVTIANVALRAVNELPVDDAFESDHVQPLAHQVRALLTEELGRIEKNDARKSALGIVIADAIVERCRRAGYRVDFALIENATMACDLESGIITFEDWFAVMPYADVIRLYEMRGDQLQMFLADNARRIACDDPGAAHFSRELDAVNARVNDVPLDQQRARVFIIAGSSFARQRDEQWQAAHRDLIALPSLTWRDTALRLRDELVAYIRAHHGITKI